MNYVIIGNSFAGIFAAEAIRRSDAEGRIKIVSKEPEHTYSRAMIHELLAGMVAEPLVYLRDADFYEKGRLDAVLGKAATRIDPAGKTVTIDDENVSYDKLLIATGARPFIPPVGGLDAVEYHTLTTMAEAQRLGSATAGRKHAVVLGAGLIGLQCAEALVHLGLHTTCVEMADTVLPMASDEAASAIILSEIEAEGMQVRTDDTIREIIASNGQPTGCTLGSGEEIPCDLLVIAVGVRADVSLAEDAGIACDRGIVVDDKMQTNVKDIYAAGDCACGAEIVTGANMALPTIPIASTHGMIAGHNMAGVERVYRGGVPLNALQFGSTQIVSYGFVKDETYADVLTTSDPSQNMYKKIIIKDGQITGALFVKAIDRTGLFRHLMENKIDVRPFQEHLLSPDFGVEHLPREVRDDMFTVPQR
jgi:nitrite reductase (NADH) large subunit